MERKFILWMMLFCIPLFTGCSANASSMKPVTIYEMKSFSEVEESPLVEVTEKEEITTILEAIKNAIENPGVADMSDPHYKIVTEKGEYFLWLDGDKGEIMNLSDTNITFSLSKQAVLDIKEIIGK